jgi:hypothetical protein
MHIRLLITLATALTIGTVAYAHDYNLGNLHIDRPYARATMPNQPSAGAYFSIENAGTSADRLVAAASPAAKSTELHNMAMEGNVMRMREVPAIEIAPSAKIVMRPGGGYHIMLVGLKQPLKAGDKFPLTLTFEKAGKIDVSVEVAASGVAKHGTGTGMPQEGMHGMK